MQESLAETHFHPDTPADVVAQLEHARRNTRRVRIWVGDTNTGEAWPDEYEVIGYISRSMGPIKIPILLHNSRSRGGGAILTECVVAIMDVQRREFVYKHKKFTTGIWSIKHALGDMYEVHLNNKHHATMAMKWRALNYVRFMRGERLCK